MTVHTFRFPQYAAERSAQLTSAQEIYATPRQRASGRAWGWLFLLSFVGGICSVVSGYVYWNSAAQHDTGAWLLPSGMVLLAVGAICCCLWVWRFLHGSPPWGRLMLLGLVVNYFVGRPLVGAYPWAAPVDSVVSWVLLVGLVLRWRELHSRRSVSAHAAGSNPFTVTGNAVGQEDKAARWAAGALGENLVADALARLGNDYVVIHNLPLDGRGDADHVVVGPAGAVVIETKYLAGRIVCQDDGAWMQVKRDDVRQIADPATQVQRAADWVGYIFGRRGLRNVPVYAVLVMAHPRAEFDVAQSPVLVVRPSELVPRLEQLARDQRCLDSGGVIAAANALVDVSPRNDRRR